MNVDGGNKERSIPSIRDSQFLSAHLITPNSVLIWSTIIRLWHRYNDWLDDDIIDMALRYKIEPHLFDDLATLSLIYSYTNDVHLLSTNKLYNSLLKPASLYIPYLICFFNAALCYGRRWGLPDRTNNHSWLKSTQNCTKKCIVCCLWHIFY